MFICAFRWDQCAFRYCGFVRFFKKIKELVCRAYFLMSAISLDFLFSHFFCFFCLGKKVNINFLFRNTSGCLGKLKTQR